jgi:transporter family protein
VGHRAGARRRARHVGPDDRELGLSGALGHRNRASWLCYFRALQLGPVSRVAPIDKLSFVIAVALGAILFHEKITWQLGAGAALIAAGVLLTLKG